MTGKKLEKPEGFFKDMAEGVDEAGRRNVHNPVPEQDIEKAFLYADRNYLSESPHCRKMRSAIRSF